MATESPMRMIETSATVNWPSSTDIIMLRSPLKDVAVDELRLLLKSQRLHGGDPRTHVPNRSGSAPPSMEGSFAAFDYLVSRQTSSQGSTEEQLCSDPAYISYYSSNINPNLRLPPPLSRRKEVDKSLRHLSELQAENTTVLPGHDSASLTGVHKSIVDLIQEDFPRTPSPVYSQSRSSSLMETEELIDHDVRVSSPNLLSRNISKEPEANTTLHAACTTDTSLLFADHASTISTIDSLEAISKSSSPGMRSSTKPNKDTSTECVGVEDDGALHSVVSCVEPRTRQKEAQQSYGRHMPQYYQSIPQGSAYQANVIAQGMSHSHGLQDNHSLGHSKFSSTDAQPSLDSPGLIPPLYATAAYMTSGNTFYPNLQLSGPYAPQYNVGGYALSPTLAPPVMAGFPSHAVVPGQFDSSSASSPNNRPFGVSTGETVANGGHLQHVSRYYGQPGLVLQTSFISPFQMQYLQHPFGNIFGASVQHGGRLESSGVSGCPANSVMLDESFTTDMADQKLHPLVNGNLSIPNPGKVGMIGNNYYGVPQSMGIVTQFTTAAFSSPVLPSSPVRGMHHLSRRNEMNFHQAPIRNVGLYSGWQGQRGVNSLNDSKRLSFLEELKSSNSRKFKLSDIAGRIDEFSVDQHGSRFIQQKLEHCSVEEKESVFKEVIPHASRLMMDVFGNYVIQKFFEHGSLQQRKELADQLAGRMLPLSLQMYGCRVIQKALEVIEVDQMIKLVHELDGHVITCVNDQNGNHVIQKCIECLPVEKIEFVINSFSGQVTSLSTHPYGCRVIQRVLEHCSEGEQSQCIVDEILGAACVLSQDQYGNYVIQHVLERGKPHERIHIINKLIGKIIQLSQHKYASNVIEKCLQYGDNAEQEILIWEIIGAPDKNDHLLIMMKDQFANYVIQKILDVCNDRQREILLNCVKTNLHALKKYTYGKHIAARFEQLSGEETQDCEEAEDESMDIRAEQH